MIKIGGGFTYKLLGVAFHILLLYANMFFTIYLKRDCEQD